MEVHSNSGRFPSLSLIPSPSRVILALTVIITLISRTQLCLLWLRLSGLQLLRGSYRNENYS